MASLKKRKDFVRVATKGLKMVRHSLVLQAAQNLCANDEPPRLGFTATKKVGKAVDRNRTKRRLRACAAKFFPKHGLKNVDYVLIGRYSTATIDFKQLEQDMAFALKKINKELMGNEENIDSAS